MRSMLKKIPISLETKGLGPYIAQFTVVSPCAPGVSVNSAVLCPSKGSMKSSLMTSFDAAVASVISMRPAPTLLLPSQA